MIALEELRNMDWNMISAISAVFMTLVIFITAIIAIRQLKEIRRSRQLDAFTNLVQFLQREDIRKARGILVEELSKKDFKDWLNAEKEAAEKACHTYDSAGIMDSRKFIEKDFIAKKWRNSIVKCWEAAQPMITEYRKERGDDFWRDFETLYKRAKESREGRNKV